MAANKQHEGDHRLWISWNTKFWPPGIIEVYYFTAGPALWVELKTWQTKNVNVNVHYSMYTQGLFISQAFTRSVIRTQIRYTPEKRWDAWLCYLRPISEYLLVDFVCVNPCIHMNKDDVMFYYQNTDIHIVDPWALNLDELRFGHG